MAENGVERLKAKRAEWKKCLSCDDRNGILPQIYSMVWEAACFRVVGEARRFAPTTPKGSMALPAVLHHLLDVCFFRAQLIAVRRQVDNAGLGGKRGVYSLMSLLQDMRNHRNLMTRWNLLEAEGLIYDCDFESPHGIEDRLYQNSTPDATDWHKQDLRSKAEPSRRRHRDIDSLCGVSADGRSPENIVLDSVLRGLQAALLEPTKRLSVYVDKFLAHAATPESRADSSEEDLTILVAELWAAHTAICRVTQTVSTLLLNDAHLLFLAFERGDEFIHFDQPLVRSEDIPRLRATWAKYEEETQNWAAFTSNELIALQNG